MICESLVSAVQWQWVASRDFQCCDCLLRFVVIGDFPKPIPMSLTNESQIAVAAGQGRQWWAGCHGNDR